MACTAAALWLANSAFASPYAGFWHHHAGGLSLEQWINDGLMAMFSAARSA